MKQVIVVGSGGWGKNLVKNFFDLGVLAGIAELDTELRQNLKIDYPGVPLFEDFREALDLPHAFVFATPAFTHHEYAKIALQSGKDVFIEKPMTLNTKDAVELSEISDQLDSILMVGHLLLYQPAIMWIRDYLASGKAGNVLHIHTQRAKLGKVRQQENVWWSFAPHDISVVLDLLGQPKISSVNATGNAMIQDKIEDNVYADLVFESGQTAHIHSSWFWPLNHRNTTVICEKQMIVYDEVAQSVTVFDKGVHSDLSNRDNGSFKADISEFQPLKFECQHFLDCLTSREKPRSDGWNGVAVVEILEKVNDSLGGRN